MYICTMAKKNTLLYLDSHLVDLAKKYNINISKITEDAIKSNLFLSKEGETWDYEEYMELLCEKEECFFLPFQIKEVYLSNIGVFEDKKIKFKEGMNLVIGENATGKTTLLRAIAESFGVIKSKYPLLRNNEKKKTYNGKIEITTTSNKLTTGYALKDGKVTTIRDNQCILIDDPHGIMTEKNKNNFLKWLSKKYNCQIIITSLEEVKLDGTNIHKIYL